MKVYVEDHMGPFTIKNVVKVEWVTKEWYSKTKKETRIVIHTEDGKVRDTHLDNIVKIEEG